MRWTLGLVVGFALAGCKSGAVTEGDAVRAGAQRVCDHNFDCDCEEYAYPSRAECTETLREQFDESLADGMNAGLSFDAECFDRSLDFITSFPCVWVEADPDAPASGCDACTVYNGSRTEGETCTEYGDYDDCIQGHRCREGRCIELCRGAGKECDPEAHSECATGLWCPAATLRCTPLPVAGEPCELDCAPEHFCDHNSICVVTPTLGEPCETQCDPYNVACLRSEGICVELPGLGEDCTDADCKFGLYCDAGDSTCAEPKLEGSSCEQSYECLSLDCADGRCSDVLPGVCVG